MQATGKEFRRLVEEMLDIDSQYDNELNAFVEYLIKQDLLDKCFDLSLRDVDKYFDSLIGTRMGVPSTLNAHIAALSNLFEYLIKKNYNFRHLLGYINTDKFRTEYIEKLEAGSQKKIIPMDILKELLYRMDLYFQEKNGKKTNNKYYHLLIARLYIELSLIIPLKPGELIEIKLGNIRGREFRKIIYNSIYIHLPNNVRKHVIETVDFAEEHYNVKYTSEDTLFGFLYRAIKKGVNPSTITGELQKMYRKINMSELLETYKSGTKNISVYPVESYKKTAIYAMLNNGVNIVYLKQLTGLEISTLLADYDLKGIKADIDVKSYNINCSLINTDYFTYL